MFNQTIFYQPITNQNLSTFYANCIPIQQKITPNFVYQNYANFTNIISYAVSIDFKNFQTQFLLNQMKNQLFNEQTTQKQNSSNVPQLLTEKTQQKIKKNLNLNSEKVDDFQTNQFYDLSQKSQKQEPKSKANTLDESSEKIEFEDCSIKENKNNVKKLKKTQKFQKSKELPLIDLIDFAEIRKECFDRSQIQRIRDNLISRQVQNWTEIQKSRRNQKLQLRRIKY